MPGRIRAVGTGGRRLAHYVRTDVEEAAEPLRALALRGSDRIRRAPAAPAQRTILDALYAQRMTRSARAWIVAGIFSPRRSAVFTLTTSSMRGLDSTGMSPGLVPLRILSTSRAA